MLFLSFLFRYSFFTIVAEPEQVEPQHFARAGDEIFVAGSGSG
jgi:hypothetical protein